MVCFASSPVVSSLAYENSSIVPLNAENWSRFPRNPLAFQQLYLIFPNIIFSEKYKHMKPRYTKRHIHPCDAIFMPYLSISTNLDAF